MTFRLRNQSSLVKVESPNSIMSVGTPERELKKSLHRTSKFRASQASTSGPYELFGPPSRETLQWRLAVGLEFVSTERMSESAGRANRINQMTGQHGNPPEPVMLVPETPEWVWPICQWRELALCALPSVKISNICENLKSAHDRHFKMLASDRLDRHAGR